MASANVHEFTTANFQADVLSSDKPVLVDFWAEWCPPCLALGPTVEKIAGEFVGKAKVGKVNVDQSRELAVKYQINSIPTSLVFKGGQVVNRFQGFTGGTESEYRNALNNATK